MAKRLTRKQIKKEDAVKSAILKFWENFQTHPIRFTSIIVLLAGIILISVAWINYSNHKYEYPEELISQALNEFNSSSEQENSPFSQDSFLSLSPLTNSAAINKLNIIIRDFPNTLYAQKALYYLGIAQLKNNKYDEAIMNFQKSLKISKDKTINDLSKFALSMALVKKQDFEGAKSIIKELINDQSSYIPKDYLLFQLADFYEQEGNIQESKKYLRKIINEIPSTTLRAEIEKKLKS